VDVFSSPSYQAGDRPTPATIIGEVAEKPGSANMARISSTSASAR